MRYLDDSTRDMSRGTLSLRSDARSGRPFDPTAVAASNPAALSRWTRRVVIATAVWSVCELPLELWVSGAPREVAACIVGKVLWVALVYFVLAGSRVARIAYGFLCTIGLLAIAFALPTEYKVFPLGFLLSSVECVLKATAFVCLVSTGIYPEEE